MLKHHTPQRLWLGVPDLQGQDFEAVVIGARPTTHRIGSRSMRSSPHHRVRALEVEKAIPSARKIPLPPGIELRSGGSNLAAVWFAGCAGCQGISERVPESEDQDGGFAALQPPI